ncbi:MAG: NAD(P)H-hydrate dehydratase [Oscillatoria sp. PMC 1051.18]|nr:NAD(P)H-hydrate dehydratase [Oscillatoria sp. PMC 1050.18]MEC5030852.1 NAD(P)H-hydrate dehydratase [Oscillatoria sp. PMC 1051.18]
MQQPRREIESVVVSAAQMQEIEGRIFAAGMPVAALMEKVAVDLAQRIICLFPDDQISRVGILVGPGHNGGDALVVARELHLAGYQVVLCRPIPKAKELTQQHANYAANLGIPCYEDVAALHNCNLIIDGLFGFGQTRDIAGNLAEVIQQVNNWRKLVVSIDLPSGIHTDTGEVLGIAVAATHTFCIGLWKRAFFQDRALQYIGQAELIDIGIPTADIWTILSDPPQIQCLTFTKAQEYLPLPRPAVTHKYKQGHLLLICGSERYAGGAILTALGARASGVGMLSIAVPETLKPLLVSHLPEALVIGCPETESGAIANLPPIAAEFDSYHAIACGPGLTLAAKPILQQVLQADNPLILDADALNILAELDTIPTLAQRSQQTILTPHPGEFKRLFPQISHPNSDRLSAAQQAAQESNSIILLKGSRTAIATPQGTVWVIPESTPALARGGSGDVLTGLIGGLVAQTTATEKPLAAMATPTLRYVATAAWWHAQAGILAAEERTELGVDAFTLSQYLIYYLSKKLTK